MKKTLLLTLVGLFLFLGICGNIFAQHRESEYYVLSAPIEKIYYHDLGYVVMYWTNNNRMTSVYVPYDWFHQAASKAELIRLNYASTWPYISVYYHEGEFSHVRLYVSRSPQHLTWGVVPMTADIDSLFDMDTLIAEF